MPKYKVTTSALWHDGVKYVRGDVIDKDYGTKTELYYEPAISASAEDKPKRRTRKKAEVSNEG